MHPGAVEGIRVSFSEKPDVNSTIHPESQVEQPRPITKPEKDKI